jgi:hypothetical protein
VSDETKAQGDDEQVREEIRQKLQENRKDMLGDAAKPVEDRAPAEGEGEGEPMIPPPATRAGG